MKKIDLILKTIPEWNKNNKIMYKPLEGGLSNITYKVDVDDRSYVLRINENQNEFLNLNRVDEKKAIIKAFEVDIAPEIFFISSKENILITEFINGTALEISKMKEEYFIKKIITTLKKIHSLEGINRISSPFELIRNYLKGAKSLNVNIPNRLYKHLDYMREIEARRAKDKDNINKYCHNDFHTGYNMILKNEKLFVIDWELSGIGDVFFDLATISSDNRFTFREDKILLENYFGNFKEEQLITLNEMKLVCMLREITWALMHEGLKGEKINHNMNYYQFANEVLDKLDQGIITL